ncbi:hypothetical protein [Cellvibrio sp. pealriver]|uniref:hypothetical protein n=1 Tax=Cellvibrio sp. pealriver TaxID=1622269 RepID=UPI00066FE3E9|nr:hypothetical protein [Cellvibrio sp. pealriver]
MIIIGSLLLLIVPLIMAFFVARYCWRQGWCARLALVAAAALISLHTHAYYFPDQPLKDRYAATLLKTSAYR